LEAASHEDRAFFRDTTRKFLESEVPLAKVRELADDPDGFERAWWKRGAELGWMSMLVPEALGGGSLGGGLADLAIVAQEMGRLVSPGVLLPANVVAAAVAERGTDAQQTSLLPDLVAGDRVATWALAEPEGAWRPGDVRLAASRRGDGFVLDGVKGPVEAAGQADVMLVVARSPEGLCQLLVPADAAGLTRTPMQGLDLVRRFAEVRFDGVCVPGTALVGEWGRAEADVRRGLEIALTLQCAETVGAVDRVFETTLAYMFDRFSFGRPLASYQALKHRFADMKMWLEACHAVTDAAALAVARDAAGAAELTSAAKAYVGDQSLVILQECVQMHGGMGVTWEHDAHLYLRRASQNRALLGTPSEHREEIARLVLDGGAG